MTVETSRGGQPGRSGPPGNSNAAKHHLHTVRRERKALVSRALDRRTDEGRFVAGKRADLIADLGGDQNLSTQEKALVDESVFLLLQLAHINAWLAKQPALVNRRTRALHPVVRERVTLVTTLRALFGDLGLKRRAKDVEPLHVYLAGKAAAASASATAATEPGGPAAGSRGRRGVDAMNPADRSAVSGAIQLAVFRRTQTYPTTNRMLIRALSAPPDSAGAGATGMHRVWMSLFSGQNEPLGPNENVPCAAAQLLAPPLMPVSEQKTGLALHVFGNAPKAVAPAHWQHTASAPRALSSKTAKTIAETMRMGNASSPKAAPSQKHPRRAPGSSSGAVQGAAADPSSAAAPTSVTLVYVDRDGTETVAGRFDLPGEEPQA